MTNEYSYFRAAGKSLEAVEKVEDAKTRMRGFETHMKESYGAYSFSPESGSFWFLPRQKVPEGWNEEKQYADAAETIYQVSRAWPAEGSADALYISGVREKMLQLREETFLEKVLQSGKMPDRKLKAGYYCQSFVRQKTEKEKSFGREDGEGIIVASPRGSYSNSNIISSDNLEYAKLDGHWYIRVPNDKNGTPVYAPPDAVPMSFEDMMSCDGREADLRARKNAAPPKPRKPAH